MAKILAKLSPSEVNQLVSLLERATGERMVKPRTNARAEFVVEVFVAMQRPYKDLMEFNEARRRAFRRD